MYSDDPEYAEGPSVEFEAFLNSWVRAYQMSHYLVD